MPPKCNRPLRDQQGLAMILVLCLGALFVALAAALVYAASLMTVSYTHLDWSVTVKVGGDNGNTYQFSDGNTTPKRISERLGSSQRMTAEATSSDQRWMRSSQYDETVYMPVSWVVVPNDSTWGNSNSGLAEGRLAAKNVEITGATIDDLSLIHI